MKQSKSSKQTEVKKAIEWIALNDEPTVEDELEISEQLSVAMASDLYGVSTKELAKKILKLRQRIKDESNSAFNVWEDTMAKAKAAPKAKKTVSKKVVKKAAPKKAVKKVTK